MITNFKRNITLEIQTEIVNQLFERLKNFSEEEIKNSEVALKELEESKMMYGSLHFVFYDLVKKKFFQIETKSYLVERLPIVYFNDSTYQKGTISELKRIHPLKAIPIFVGLLGLDSPVVLKRIINNAKVENLFYLSKTKFYTSYDSNKKMITEKLTNLSPFYNQLIVDSSLKGVSPLLLELFQEGVTDVDVFDVGKKVIRNLFGMPSKGSNQFDSKWSEEKEKFLLYFYLFQDDKKLVENWVQTMMSEIDYHLENGQDLVMNDGILKSEIVTALLPLSGIIPDVKEVLMKLNSLEEGRIKAALHKIKTSISEDTKPFSFEQEFLLKCLAGLLEKGLPSVSLYYPRLKLTNILYSKYCTKMICFGEGDDLVETNRFLGDGYQHHEDIEKISNLSDKWNITISGKVLAYKNLLEIYLDNFNCKLDNTEIEEFSKEQYDSGYQSASDARSEEFDEERKELEQEKLELEARIENLTDENRDLQEQISHLEQELDNYR